MDTQTLAVVVVIGIFALLVIFLALRYRRRMKARIEGPFGTELDVEGSNNQPAPDPGVTVKGSMSKSGELKVEDRTGCGTNVQDVQIHGDIEATSEPPPNFSIDSDGGGLEGDREYIPAAREILRRTPHIDVAPPPTGAGARIQVYVDEPGTPFAAILRDIRAKAYTAEGGEDTYRGLV